MLEERTLGDADEALSSKPRETEQVIEDVVDSRLVERVFVLEDRETNAIDLAHGCVLLNGGVEEREEEGVEDPARVEVGQRRFGEERRGVRRTEGRT